MGLSAKLTKWAIIAVVVLFSACFARADNTRQLVQWQSDQHTDAMTNEVSVSMDGTADFPDGHVAQLTASCSPAVIAFTIDTFSGNNGEPYAWDGTDVGARVMIDGGDVTNVTLSENKYNNEATVFFFDSDSYDALESSDLSSSTNQESGMATLLTGLFGKFEITGASGGTEEQLAAAHSVLVDLPLSDGSDDVLDLNPTDPTLAPFIADCVKSTAAAMAPVLAAQQVQVQKDTALLDHLNLAASNGDSNAQCYLYFLYSEGTASYRDSDGYLHSTNIDQSLEDNSKAAYWKSQFSSENNGSMPGGDGSVCQGPPP